MPRQTSTFEVRRMILLSPRIPDSSRRQQQSTTGKATGIRERQVLEKARARSQTTTAIVSAQSEDHQSTTDTPTAAAAATRIDADRRLAEKVQGRTSTEPRTSRCLKEIRPRPQKQQQKPKLLLKHYTNNNNKRMVS